MFPNMGKQTMGQITCTNIMLVKRVLPFRLSHNLVASSVSAHCASNDHTRHTSIPQYWVRLCWQQQPQQPRQD